MATEATETEEEKGVEMTDLTTKSDTNPNEDTKEMNTEQKHQDQQTQTLTNEIDLDRLRLPSQSSNKDINDLSITSKSKSKSKHKSDDTMEEISKHKSILDTRMSHGERFENPCDMLEFRYYFQAAIGWILAFSTFIIQWALWKYMKISQCEDDIKYLSYNNFATAVFEGFQNGFCWMFGFIYLITATIIDYQKCEKEGIYHVNIRKIRIILLSITTFVAFLLTMFVAFYDPLLYYIRFPTFMVIIAISYHIWVGCIFKRYLIDNALWLLLPALVYIITIAVIFVAGLGAILLLKDNEYAFATCMSDMILQIPVLHKKVSI